MKLYDKDIKAIKQYLKDVNNKEFEYEKKEDMWPLNDKEELILKSDMAYELGGGKCDAVSGLAFTSDKKLLPKSKVTLIGPDLSEINSDCSYARITFIRLSDKILSTDEDNLYRVLKKINYIRYHIYPKGYMIRISSVNEREPVRIAKSAVKDKISFYMLGESYNSIYEKQPEVEAVETIFITDLMVDYDFLKKKSHKFEMITESLNHIYEDLKMDCSVCQLKPVCDEVEGLRSIHLNYSKKAN